MLQRGRTGLTPRVHPWDDAVPGDEQGPAPEGRAGCRSVPRRAPGSDGWPSPRRLRAPRRGDRPGLQSCSQYWTVVASQRLFVQEMFPTSLIRKPVIWNMVGEVPEISSAASTPKTV